MIQDTYAGVSAGIRTALTELVGTDDPYHRGHARRLARTLQVLLDRSPTGRLLELGTGAVVPLALRRLAPALEVHVTDYDLDLPPVGDMRLELAGDRATVPAYRVNLEQTPLPVPDETFDHVLCTEVIEHMEVDPMFMLSEINRVLRPGGTLVLTTPNAVSSRAISKMLRGVEPYFYMQYRLAHTLDRHNYEYSVHSLVTVLRAAGFDGDAWTEDSFEEPEHADVSRLRAAGYRLDHVGDNIFAVMQKTGPVLDRHPGVIYSD